MTNDKTQDSQRLVEKLFQKFSKPQNSPSSADSFDENIDTVEELLDIIPSIVLKKLYELKKSGEMKNYTKEENACGIYGSPIFHCAELLHKTALEEHAHAIGKMLKWDELYKEDDPTTRHLLIRTLGKIGGIPEIKCLKIFERKVKKVSYHNRGFVLDETVAEYRKNDRRIVHIAINAIEERNL